GRLAQRFNLLQLLQPQLVDFVVECQASPAARARTGATIAIALSVRNIDYKARALREACGEGC
ncbi:MAG TPA: hypothetical protein VMH85_15815, partial [Terriglobales bacterium]|nr:hypothetical protein [Terriglobales bacterium]